MINNLFYTLRQSSRLRLVLNTRFLLLYCRLMLRVVKGCRMLLLPDGLLVGQLLVVVWCCEVVLIKRLLVRRWLPVDRQLGHDVLISGTVCVMSHVVIWHHILCLRVLLAGLVP